MPRVKHPFDVQKQANRDQNPTKYLQSRKNIFLKQEKWNTGFCDIFKTKHPGIPP